MPRYVTLLLAVVLLVFAAVGEMQAGKKGKTTYAVSLKGQAWSLEVDLPDFKVERRKTRTGSSQSTLFAAGRHSLVVVSIFLERKANLQSAEECRDHYQAKSADSPFQMSDISRTSTETMAQVHYLIKEFQGVQLNQKNINAYMYRDGVCIDIHLSALEHKPSDGKVFEAVLDSVRYLEN